MYRIAICEDERHTLDANTSLTESILSELGINGEITPFQSAEELLCALDRDESAFDLLLDIILVKMNRIELARELRRRGINAAIAL